MIPERDGLEEIGLGHNQPPAPTLFERVRALVDNCNRWLKERPAIINTEMAGKASEFVEQLRLEREALVAAAKVERKPHDEAIIEIRARYATPTDLVDLSLQVMEAKQRDWLKRERDRIEAAEAERRRLAAEAQAKADQARRDAAAANTVDAELEAQQAAKRAAELQAQAAAAPKRARAKGDLSRKAMTLHANWQARIVDEATALKHYAKHPAIRAAALGAIKVVARDHAKAAKDPSKAPPGIEFFNDERAQ